MSLLDLQLVSFKSISETTLKVCIQSNDSASDHVMLNVHSLGSASRVAIRLWMSEVKTASGSCVITMALISLPKRAVAYCNDMSIEHHNQNDNNDEA